MPSLRGMAWDHPRGVAPLRAGSEAFSLAHPETTIEWDARSLADFEEVPVGQLAHHYDFIAIDHPFVGSGQAQGALAPLDELLPRALWRDLAANSVGPSLRSYRWQGSYWAVPVDAAAQVSAYRADLLQEYGLASPTTWDDVFDTLDALPGQMGAFAASPTHLLSSLLTLCAGQDEAHPERLEETDPRPPDWWSHDGLDPDVIAPALQRLYCLLNAVLPESLEMDPIRLLNRMSQSDDIAYAPLVYGYSNYARLGAGPNVLTFADIPHDGERPVGSQLGGVGLAVSAQCRQPEVAAAFLTYVMSVDCQRGLYYRSGGQPGHRAAWLDPEINLDCGGFFRDTLATLDHAWVRPREPAYPEFQRRAGRILHQLLTRRAAISEVVEAVNGVWRSVSRDTRETEHGDGDG